MILLNADQIVKSYTERPLLKGLNFSVFTGDKIGFIGLNGAGKSTFLKILAGIETPESGTLTKASGVRINYLSQNPVFAKDCSALEQVLLDVSHNERASKEYECKTILTKLGISNFDEPVAHLSGGQKKRVALASALVSPAEILILDEPTNHLDNEMADWLEKFLLKYPGALLLITHDRYFLDRVTNQIVEIADGLLYSFPGNYTKYLEGKIVREEMTLATERKRTALYRKEREWMHRGARARSTKSKSRIERFQELHQSLLQERTGNLQVQSLASRLGKKIIELHQIFKGYGEKQLIQDFTYLVVKGDRIGIVGPNGAGKSTLLKMILGTVSPDAGRLEIGDTVKIGYFSQENEEMDLSLRMIDYVQQGGRHVVTPDGSISASQMLERFLFPSSTHSTLLSKLSGGERKRLQLLRILMNAPNVLLLDEPTNDLDVQTLSVLEDYLENFPGVVIAISHDRYFLDRVVHRIFALGEDDTIGHYPGGYSDYLEIRRQEETENAPGRTALTKQPTRNDNRPDDKKVRFTYREQKEYESIESDIAALEQQISELESQVMQASSDYGRLQELLPKKQELEDLLAHKMERWVYLQDLADKM